MMAHEPNALACNSIAYYRALNKLVTFAQLTLDRLIDL